MASLLFLTSFCLFSFLFCSTSYCVPINSIGGNDNDWKLGLGSERSGLKVPSSIFSLVEICKGFYQARNQKVICLFCKGFDLSCLVTSPPTPPPTTRISSTTPITTSSTTTTTSTVGTITKSTTAEAEEKQT